MGAIQLHAGAIGVDRSGSERSGVPILFLHGVGSDKSVWAPQLSHFGQTRPALAIDYPGYGESDARPGVGRDGFARAAIELLDSLDIDRAHICGLSLGGVVAIALHQLAPERCASLILADSFAVHPDGSGIYRRSVDASLDPGMAAMAAARVPMLVGAAASEPLKADLTETMAQIDPEAFRQGAEAVWLAEQVERAAAIAVPTLVLVGDEDKVTPPALSEELAALVPGAKLAVIEGAGHLANIEQPEAFNAVIDDFITAVEAAW